MTIHVDGAALPRFPGVDVDGHDVRDYGRDCDGDGCGAGFCGVGF